MNPSCGIEEIPRYFLIAAAVKRGSRAGVVAVSGLFAPESRPLAGYPVFGITGSDQATTSARARLGPEGLSPGFDRVMYAGLVGGTHDSMGGDGATGTAPHLVYLLSASHWYAVTE